MSPPKLRIFSIGAVGYEGDDPTVLARIDELKAEEERRQRARIHAAE